jgi:hypothetical protein
MISRVLIDVHSMNVIKCLPVVLPFGFRIVRDLQLLHYIAALPSLIFLSFVRLFQVVILTVDRYFVSAQVSFSEDFPKNFQGLTPRRAFPHKLFQLFAHP